MMSSAVTWEARIAVRDSLLDGIERKSAFAPKILRETVYLGVVCSGRVDMKGAA